MQAIKRWCSPRRWEGSTRPSLPSPLSPSLLGSLAPSFILWLSPWGSPSFHSSFLPSLSVCECMCAYVHTRRSEEDIRYLSLLLCAAISQDKLSNQTWGTWGMLVQLHWLANSLWGTACLSFSQHWGYKCTCSDAQLCILGAGDGAQVLVHM